MRIKGIQKKYPHCEAYKCNAIIESAILEIYSVIRKHTEKGYSKY